MSSGLNGETRLFPILGDPIRYVQSPRRLTAGFASRGYNGLCCPMQVAHGALPDVMRALASIGNVDGLLITMPHKFDVVVCCATTSDRTKLLGAASVVRRNGDGSWHGDMLDGIAFVKAQRDAGAKPESARVLLVGAGAAGGAIAIALLDAGVRELIIHDRDAERSRALLSVVSAIAQGRARVGAPEPNGCDMVCNASSAGMDDGDELPVAATLLAPSMFVGDVISGHGTTPFLRAAQAAGCRTASGDQMVEAVQGIMMDFMLQLE
jgi:shikimate dehydrogenase